jgi:glutamine synthetase
VYYWVVSTLDHSIGPPRNGTTETNAGVVKAAKDRNVKFIDLQFIDIPGSIKGVSVPIERLAACFEEGVWFDGSSVEGLARLAESDLYLQPDPSTFAIMPWKEPTTGRLLCDLVTPDGVPFAADPRFVLRRILTEANDLGYSYRVGAEVEFYLFEEDAADRAGNAVSRRRGVVEAAPLFPSDTRGYFELPDDRAATLCQNAVKIMREFGYQMAATHHEASPGQHEFDLGPDDAIRTADAIVALKLIIRAMASKAGLRPTFMPKPIENATGSGVHLSQFLVDPATGQNAFFDPLGDHQLSGVARSFVAGQIAHARGMSAVLAPLVNSYKRLLGGDEAPSEVDWARTNRSAFIRIPEVTHPAACLIEARAPDPSFNPYLGLAVLLHCGLEGIRSRFRLGPPAEQSPGRSPSGDDSVLDRLPSTLGEALSAIESDMVVRSALGQPLYERFATAKEQEWLAYRHHISRWELETYLDSA